MEANDKKRKRQDKEDASLKETDTVQNVKTSYTSLERPEGQGMNPKSILLGSYGPRGEKIRHTVHQGSMKLPASAIEILNHVQTECVKHTGVNKLQEQFSLPAIDGVVRPSMDNTKHSAIIITELTSTERPPPQPVAVQTPHGMMLQPPPLPTNEEKWVTHARNWKLKLPSKTEVEERLRAAAPDNEETTVEQRIRGGGGEEHTMVQRIRGGGDDDDVVMVDLTDDTNKAQGSQTTSENVAAAAAPTAAAFEPPKSPTKSPAKSADASQATAETKPAASSTEAAPAAATAGTAAAAAAAATSSSTTTATAPAPAIASAVTSTAPASVVSGSSMTAPAETAKPKVPAVIPLPAKPKDQWEQHKPGPNDEMQTEPKTPKPSWYNTDKVSDFERKMLPEWFNDSATHRTPDSYKQARESMIEISDKVGNRYVTGTLVRRTVAGDAGSLLRLHNFLNTFGFINEDATFNESTPTPPGFREDDAAPLGSKTNIVWNDAAREQLMEAVVDESKKRRKTDDDEASVPIDWAVVSKRVGNGASASDCEKMFLALPLEAAAEKVNERSITPEVTSSEQKSDGTDVSKSTDLRDKILKDLVDRARPEVVKAATDAALAATDNVAEAQKAGLLALAASEAAVRAKQEEDTVSRLLAELQEQRLQKLENRMALLDDVEGVLEAERVALELERRDLYTARCRQWFGGAS